MAHHDALTNLPNRVLFRIRMEELLRASDRQDARLAILCLDLDYFKNVNDTLGHPVGDALLEAVADRLHNCMREGDIVARIGGDEFAILVPLSDHGDRAERLAQRIVQTFERAVRSRRPTCGYRRQYWHRACDRTRYQRGCVAKEC